MEENTTFDWIKDDPCYGCKYAKRLAEFQIEGIFGRRFGCTSRNRRNALVKEAAELANEGSPYSVDKAFRLLGKAFTMDTGFSMDGYCDCSTDLCPGPECYEKEENTCTD